MRHGGCWSVVLGCYLIVLSMGLGSVLLAHSMVMWRYCMSVDIGIW